MKKRQADIKADIGPDIFGSSDRNEKISLMEPMVISSGHPERSELGDLALELAQKSANLRSGLPKSIVSSLANLVRAMNCYYSNLIEGHNTHPIDIERALRGDYSKDPKKRELQLEAKAHIAVQQWIDDGGLRGRPTTVAAITEVHRRFCETLPDSLLQIEDPVTKKMVSLKAGNVRDRDVQVGRHIAVSPGSLQRFLRRYEESYGTLGKSETLISLAAAHHRLLWIHPFLDGNGRVARLISHAMLQETLETAGIWSAARGLARNESAYKQHLIACDEKRRGDLDGRGNLSEAALVDFTRFFLITCIDQVTFMESLIEPNQLRQRILSWTTREINLGKLAQNSGALIEAMLFRGELLRSDAAHILNVSDRQARRVVASLLEQGIFQSKSDRAPLTLAFPAKLAADWMPGLFPAH